MAFLLAGCATGGEVARQYAHDSTAFEPSKKTVVFFLIDGLPIRSLNQGFDDETLPAMKHYFGAEIHRARTTFPSLTFPAISSLLSERPVELSGIYGNHVFNGTDELNFESPKNYGRLNELLRDRTVFSRMKIDGRATVSFDYAFHAGSTTHTQLVDLESGVLAVEEEFEALDDKTITSLQRFLDDTPQERWPTFIFVHVLGLDSVSHSLGPDTFEANRYLQKIDTKLAPVFESLRKAEERGRRVISLLSADHGFDRQITKVMKLEESLKQSIPDLRVLNEGRYLALFFPRSLSESQRTGLIKDLAKNPDIDITAMRTREVVEARSSQIKTKFKYHNSSSCEGAGYSVSFFRQGQEVPREICPSELEQDARKLFYPYFIPDLARYFQAADHPDAIIIGQPGISFLPQYLGQHGGPTEQELFIPLLLRNAHVTGTPPIWKLLHSF